MNSKKSLWTMRMGHGAAKERVSTGVAGLDEVLFGFIPRTSYLVRGGQGQGKTTLGLHFLTASPQESALFIGFQEPEAQLLDEPRSPRLALVDVSGFGPAAWRIW